MTKQPSVAAFTQVRFRDQCFGTVIKGLPRPLPCPFCGRTSGVCIVEVPALDMTTYHVECSNCGGQGPCGGSELDVAIKWNRREAHG